MTFKTTRDILNRIMTFHVQLRQSHDRLSCVVEWNQKWVLKNFSDFYLSLLLIWLSRSSGERSFPGGLSVWLFCAFFVNWWIVHLVWGMVQLLHQFFWHSDINRYSWSPRYYCQNCWVVSLHHIFIMIQAMWIFHESLVIPKQHGYLLWVVWLVWMWPYRFPQFFSNYLSV